MSRHSLKVNMCEQETAPLPSLRGATNFTLTFSEYLSHYKLTVVEVARAAGLPAITVWRVARGQNVTAAHARQVRQGLYQLTGVLYPGQIRTTV